MTTTELQAALGLEPLSLSGGTRVITGWRVGDLLSHVLAHAKRGDAWITILASSNVIAVAQLADVACVILAEGVEVSSQVIAQAKAHGVNLFRSAMPAHALCVAGVAGN